MSEIKPKKALGQHWLEDVEALQAMCAAAAVSDTDTVVEIGPGLGTLTKRLTGRAQSVIAIEFDETLAVNLIKLVPHENLTVIHEDILKFDLGSVPHPYKVVANIPYYLTSNLIRVLSESSNPPSVAVLLMQKEVAERICAKPGNMSILSVTAQYYWEVDLGRVVEAELFIPPPKVDSQILRMKYRQEPLFDKVDTKQFFRLVKAGFSQKRKTLQNALSGGLAMPKARVKEILDSADIPLKARAQMLSLDDWYALYDIVVQPK